LWSAAQASAQFLTFVSATGNDANTCFVQASPCKTLQRGINQTSTGGEVRVLSQLTSNGFINRSMTIDAGGQTIIGTLIVDSPSAVVAFRRIVLTGRGAYGKGFDIRNAAAVHIEDSTAERFIGEGILLRANVSTSLFVADSVSRNNDIGLAVLGPSSATIAISNSRFERSDTFGVSVGGGRVSVTDSVASANSTGISLSGGTMNITRTSAVDNANSGYVVAGGEMTLESAVARGNSTGLLATSSTMARISNCVITNNAIGISNSSGANTATIETQENNLVRGNSNNVLGALTLLGGGV
jgi:hypothetical protein